MNIVKPEHVRETRSQAWKKSILPLGKEYPVFPFGSVFHLIDNGYSIFTRSFDGHGDPWIHVIIGPEKALLIDTGFGIGNLKGLVDELTGHMPLIVVNTHPHIDHCYGNCQFDRVYCHEYAVPILRGQDSHMWEYLVDEKGKGLWRDFDIADIVPFRPYEIIGCKNHTVFDLGDGYEVEMIFMPGHDPAHCCFLDKQDRILYGGDTLLFVAGLGDNGIDYSKIPHGEFCTVEALRNELLHLVPRMDEFDSIFMSHMVLGEDKKLVRELFEACDAVVKDPDCNEFIHHDRHSDAINKVKVFGDAAVEYCDSRVYMDTILHT